MMINYHVPVMLQECMDGLQINPSGTYVDVTYGGGGHARAILDRLGEDGTLLVFDQDADAVKNRIDDPRLHFCEANFRYLENFCSYYKVGPNRRSSDCFVSNRNCHRSTIICRSS